MPTNFLNSIILDEISNLCEKYSIDSQTLEDFANFVIKNHQQKPPKTSKKKSASKPSPSKTTKAKLLTLTQLKSAVYAYFNVS